MPLMNRILRRQWLFNCSNNEKFILSSFDKLSLSKNELLFAQHIDKIIFKRKETSIMQVISLQGA